METSLLTQFASLFYASLLFLRQRRFSVVSAPVGLSTTSVSTCVSTSVSVLRLRLFSVMTATCFSVTSTGFSVCSGVSPRISLSTFIFLNLVEPHPQVISSPSPLRSLPNVRLRKGLLQFLHTRISSFLKGQVGSPSEGSLASCRTAPER